MAQFQPISLSQSVQLPSQQSVQQQQQQQILQQNPCQYQLEPCDIKPQFSSLIPSISQTLNSTNNSNNNMNLSQGGIGSVGALMTTLDNVVSGINNVTTGQFVTSMNHADVASLLMNPSKRAETFVIDEVKVMLKEIEARKHILLSLSPSTNRLKRRAWEEVAVCMANRWPHAPRRTADQVKKKWENLVSKTKRKVRAGHITPELDWNETNAAVMQFLTQHSPPVRLRYLTSTTPSLFNLEENDVDMTNITNVQNTTTVEGASDVGNITGSVHESFLSSFSPFNQSFINFGLPSTTESFYTTFSRDIQKELYLQLKQEHELRMDILRLQKQTWLLQMNLFKKMKAEQISSLFSSPSLMMNTTSVTPLTTTTTTPTPTTAPSMSTSSVATTTTTDPVSSMNSTCTTSISSNTTTVTNETTSNSSIIPKKLTSNSISHLKKSKEEEGGEEEQEEIESQCIISKNSLSPMFPQDGSNGINNHDSQQDNLLNDHCRLNNETTKK
ncbi:hypothetical protein Smp_009300 [Schistosoma mansoni]|uniref:hypothetical protein n=1 Tax=Schistosoma mansoni TaxID=6183 RepID=UPI00022DC4F6|nr:hypothetical protein Smp_009300 [Schistosoma mansoni]|eukprot:XP_018653425.1 hypothetical protein Smp_009300 [Schistosoma mansoni]